MSLPLPTLDTRRWEDLVEEGRALIARHAPQWTDHNIHDVGITLAELFAWILEQDLYRLNRISARHLRKFLALAGFPPRLPEPAHAVLEMNPQGKPTILVPQGVVLEAARGSGEWVHFETSAVGMIQGTSLHAIQVHDGAAFADRTSMWRDGLPVVPFGEDPSVSSAGGSDDGPALYLGFDRPPSALPPGTAGDSVIPLGLYLRFEGMRPGERERLERERGRRAASCRRPAAPCPRVPSGGSWCPSDEDRTDRVETFLPSSSSWRHHSVRTVWELRMDGGWRAIGAGDTHDETCGLTLDGFVRLQLPVPIVAARVGAVDAELFWIRCRFVSGTYDSTPVIRSLVFNAVPATQTATALHEFAVAPGSTPSSLPEPGTRGLVPVTLDEHGRLVFEPRAPANAPEALFLSYVPAGPAAEGRLGVTLAPIGWGDGLPEQEHELAPAPVAAGDARVWSHRGGAWQRWSGQPDLDASGPLDADFELNARAGTLRLGDGERGRVATDAECLIGTWRTTAGAAGNISSDRWRIADHAINTALLGGPAPSVAVAQCWPAEGGSDGEDPEEALARAAESLWAHEQLVELARAGASSTFDQLDRDQVLARTTPQRAANLLDFERLAIDAPGTRLRRVRAWANLDPDVPGFEAPGTVTLVVVPGLPRSRPQPSAALLDALRRYLDPRRVLCTRLVLTGPTYLVAQVTARVRSLPGADVARVRADVLGALHGWLNPLSGGPAGAGWPFGRDVYRSEIFHVIDTVPGVDHVLSLSLDDGSGEPSCGNLCVPPTWLVACGDHRIEVLEP